MRQSWGQEWAITGNRLASWSFAEAYGAVGAGDAANAESDRGAEASTDSALHWAQQRAQQAGVRQVTPGTGAALRLLAATAGAKSVVEIGTGTGVSGIHLLQGMRPDGVLTTVDVEPQLQQYARQAFRAAGFTGNRARIISGRALDVLPRLADGGYDMVFCDADPMECLDYLDESLRLLRQGGLVCFEGVFADGRTVDSAAQPDDVRQLRDLLRAVKESRMLMPALLPVGDGLLCAVRRA